jgi:hypothetical protein
VTRLACVLALALGALLALPAGALAGRVIATGHDQDLHCSSGSGCHYVNIAVSYVRGGAPDPTKPLLVLDTSTQVSEALDRAFPGGPPARVVMAPRSPEWAAASLTPANYSAIIVASDASCGGCALNSGGGTEDSDAINARKAAIEGFFNAGGGVLAFAGANHGGADTNTADDVYYNFLPLPVGAVAVSPPFTLTPEGQALGFQDSTKGVGTENDINCCLTHNSFNLPPAGSALKVAETDSEGKAETLFGEGSVSGGTITTGPPTSGPVGSKPPLTGPGGVVTGLPSTKRCVSRRNFRIRIRERKGRTYVTASVFLNGRRVAVRRDDRIRAPIDLRGLPKGRYRVKIVVVTTTGEVIQGTRKYRTCSGKRRPRRPPRL